MPQNIKDHAGIAYGASEHTGCVNTDRSLGVVMAGLSSKITVDIRPDKRYVWREKSFQSGP
jgi:hypothetical protein